MGEKLARSSQTKEAQKRRLPESKGSCLKKNRGDESPIAMEGKTSWTHVQLGKGRRRPREIPLSYQKKSTRTSSHILSEKSKRGWRKIKKSEVGLVGKRLPPRQKGIMKLEPDLKDHKESGGQSSALKEVIQTVGKREMT